MGEVALELKELNRKFKQVATLSELLDFIEEVDSYGRGYTLKMKRSRYYAYGFVSVGDSNRVQYLISDGNSVRESNVENLYKNIVVEE